jgi:hypothetical protein
MSVSNKHTSVRIRQLYGVLSQKSSNEQWIRPFIFDLSRRLQGFRTLKVEFYEDQISNLKHWLASYRLVTLSLALFKFVKARSQNTLVPCGGCCKSSSENCHFNPKGWFSSRPRNNKAEVEPVLACHALLDAMLRDGRLSSHRVCWKLW